MWKHLELNENFRVAVAVTQADVAVLEEPEHLTWFHHGQRWTDVFKHVVGVIHTNYVDYIRRGGGRAAAISAGYLNRRVCCIHCHKVGLCTMRFCAGSTVK